MKSLAMLVAALIIGPIGLSATTANAQTRDPAMSKPPAKSTTTTQLAAEAKQREGQTGTSNKNASKELQRLEAEEKKAQPKKK